MKATYTDEQLRSLFQSSFNINVWCKFLYDFFEAREIKAMPEKIDTNSVTTDDGYYLGNLDNDGFRIGMFYYEIKHGSVANRRVGLRNLVRSFINPRWGEFDAALVVFNSGDHWRLSFICDIKGESTSPKRYTYVFGSKELLYKTPIERFKFLQQKGISFETMKKAFSVEALSDEFFDKYREQYANFVQYVTGKRVVKVGGKWEERKMSEPDVALMSAFGHDDKKVRDYIKKMMGRITFLHFLQRKRWLCGDLNYMQNLYERSKYKDNYLDAVLEPLFFGILNTKPAERHDLFVSSGWDLALLEEWKDIPYLNGGLFERDEEDEPDSVFPAKYFSQLFQFFSEYNFTIDENDPNDAEVGVDPEMLGKIFENLLEDNKDKGAFYTPKEIVRYMCQESLIAYLETNTSIAVDKLRNFVLSPEDNVTDIPQQKRPKLIEALQNVKICDPAIGSGAFPMGLLNELLRCREALSAEHYDRAELKKSIIQNNIYGVDVEKGAVDIARLRFWLSIVVDEDTPSPLPNLDYKIMQGNSLIESFEGIDLSKLVKKHIPNKNIDAIQTSILDEEIDIHQNRLSLLLSEYFTCCDHDRKVQLQNQISKSINAQLDANKINSVTLSNLKTINIAANNKFFLWHTWFADVFEKGGFDIVIGNPPYVDYRKIDDLTKRGIIEYSTYKQEKKGSLYVYFIEKGLRLTTSKGILIFINPYQYLSAESGYGIRNYVINNHSLKSIVDVSNIKVFDTANTYTCINTFIAESSQDDIFVYKPTLLTHLNVEVSVISKNDISEHSNYEIIISSNKIVSKIEQIKTKLNDYCSIFCGLSKTGFRNYVSYQKENNFYQPFVESKQIERYITNTQKYIDTSLYSNKAKIVFNDECLFMCRMTSKVRVALSLARQMGGKINVLHDFESKESKLFVLGVLNSRLINYYYCKKNETKHLNGGALPFDTESVKIIPIPKVTLEKQKEISLIVEEIIELKRNNVKVSESLENNIDKIIYDMYGLTEAEIKIIEQCV